MTINKKVLLDYLLLLFVIAMSGVPYIYNSSALKILLLTVLLLVFILRGKYLNISFILIFTLLAVITLIQPLQTSYISMVTTIGLFSTVLSAYLIVKVLEDKFMNYYIKLMYYIAIVSLVFYLPILLIPAIGSFLVHSIVPLFDVFDLTNSIYETILIYNLSHIHIFRNSGPFWEPGAFAGYLMIAFMFNFIKETKKMNKTNIVLFIALFTTMSTTAILALFIFLFFLYYKLIKNIFIKMFIVISLLSISITSYFSLDFLGQKIEEQFKYETSKEALHDKHNTGRFVSIMRDINDIKGHELIGRGGNFATRYATEPSKTIVIRTSGVSDVIVKYGIVFFIVMLFFLYKSICNYITVMGSVRSSQLVCFSLFISIIVGLTSQIYFVYPLYWSLLFLQYGYTNKNLGV